MTKLSWARPDPSYESGVDRGVLYLPSGQASAWNGLTAINEEPEGADTKADYLDGVKLRQRRRPDLFSGTIEAFTYPDLLDRTPFGLSYRVSSEHTYKIHLVYDVLTAPSQMNYRYAETDPFSWAFTTKPQKFPGGKIGSHLVIDSATAYPDVIAAIEDLLYGGSTTLPVLPTPEEIFEIFEENSILQIIDHGDGTWSAIGPDDVIIMLDADTFQITWPSAIYISAGSYTISSL